MSLANPNTYAGWLALIRDWLDIAGTDISDTQIAYSLQLAQDELNKVLDSWRMEKQTPLTALSNGPIDLSIITDFNRVQLVTGGIYGQALKALAFNDLINVNATITAGGIPPATNCFYAVQSQKLYTIPMPVTGDVFQMYYYGIVPSLSASQATNVFSLYHEEALLYTSLVAASQFIAEDERTKTWAELAAQAIESINLASKGSKMGSTPLTRKFSATGSIPGIDERLYS